MATLSKQKSLREFVIAKIKPDLTTVIVEVVQLQDGLQDVPVPLRRRAGHLHKLSKAK